MFGHCICSLCLHVGWLSIHIVCTLDHLVKALSQESLFFKIVINVHFASEKSWLNLGGSKVKRHCHCSLVFVYHLLGNVVSHLALKESYSALSQTSTVTNKTMQMSVGMKPNVVIVVFNHAICSTVVSAGVRENLSTTSGWAALTLEASVPVPKRRDVSIPYNPFLYGHLNVNISVTLKHFVTD